MCPTFISCPVRKLRGKGQFTSPQYNENFNFNSFKFIASIYIVHIVPLMLLSSWNPRCSFCIFLEMCFQNHFCIKCAAVLLEIVYISCSLFSSQVSVSINIHSCLFWQYIWRHLFYFYYFYIHIFNVIFWPFRLFRVNFLDRFDINGQTFIF